MTVIRKQNELDVILNEMGDVYQSARNDWEKRIGDLPVNVESDSHEAGASLIIRKSDNQQFSDYKLADKIAESVQARKLSPSGKMLNDMQPNSGGEMNIGDKLLKQDVPLKAGVPVTYTYQDEFGNDIHTTYVLLSDPKKGGLGITYCARRGGEDNGELVVVKEFHPQKTWRDSESGSLLLDIENDKDTKLFFEAFKKEPERIIELKKKQGQTLNVRTMYHLKSKLDELKLVIPITPTFQDPKNHNWYYVMEYVPGSTLSTIMRSFTDDEHSAKSLPLAYRLDIVDQLCTAIVNLHSIECVHQDISPNNVMVYFDAHQKMQVKVIDYGLATTLIHVGNKSSSLVKEAGTPGFSDVFSILEEYKKFYLNGQKDKMKLIDVYSLGAMLGYLILTSVDSIKDEHFGEIYALTLQRDELFKEIALNENDDPLVYADKHKINLVKKLVKDATVKDLNKRIQSAEEFQRRLREIIAITPESLSHINAVSWLDKAEKVATNIESLSNKIKNLAWQDESSRSKWTEADQLFKEAESLRHMISQQVQQKDFPVEHLLDKTSECSEKYAKAYNQFKELEEVLFLPNNSSGTTIDETENVAQEEASEIKEQPDESTIVESETEEDKKEESKTDDNGDNKTDSTSNNSIKVFMGILALIVLLAGGYYFYDSKLVPESHSQTSEEVSPATSSGDEMDMSVDTDAMNRLNTLMVNAATDPTSMQELKDMVRSDVKILANVGESLMDTGFTLDNLYGTGNTQYIIGKTHRVVEVEHIGEQISVIILETIN